MRFGFHISIAGGFSKVVERALQKECQTIQLFSRNPRGWYYNKLDRRECENFQREIQKYDISPIFVHMPYLPNLATDNKDIYQKSFDSLLTELERCGLLGVHFLIMHIGKRMGNSEKNAISQVSISINKAFEKIKNSVILLLENTAGMGSEIGYHLDQISEIFKNIKAKERLGIVIDTAHIFEAGYPIHTKQGLDQMLKEFDSLIGLKYLYLLHLNDSKSDLASKLDRHWHIGEGKIGLDGMKRIINHGLLKHLPMIMETPKKDEKDDLKNMRVVKNLAILRE